MVNKNITKVNLKPAPGVIVVEPFDAAQKTDSGIYLPESSDEKPQKGKVLVVGGDTFQDGVKVTSPVKKGDVVIYKKWGGSEVKVDGKEYLFAKFEDILAVEEN